MIRSTKVSNKFANRLKLSGLYEFIDEYKNVVVQLIDLMWDMEKVPVLPQRGITNQINSWLSARAVQCAAKQASGIVRGTRVEQLKRLFVIDRLKKEGQFKKARKLEAVYNKNVPKKPDIENVEPELDSRFVHIDLDNKTSFDGYLVLSSLGRKLKIKLPFKRTTHFNKLYTIGVIKRGVRLSKKNFTFMFEINQESKNSGDTIGIDIGKCQTLSCSNGFQTKSNNHGHDLNSILNRMSRKKKGSKSFKREVCHRKNYINWSINQLNLAEIKKVKIEKIKNLRKGRKSSRMLSHWTYADIFDKLKSRCEEQGVLVEQIVPTYTSQRCSECGWTRKSNRKGKQFKCKSCGFTHDSDLNAALNIALDLKPINRKERQLNLNRTGFYWLVGGEHIVPHVKKA